jgi:oxygen-independent coproporphyrinogen-3 oxidase
MSISSELLNKYNVAGPRYTSYPTVPFWEHTPTEQQWVESLNTALTEASINNVGAALYIHIPFCRRLCTYCGCNNRITRKPGVAEPYIQTILKEYDIYLKKLGQTRLPISEIHLGGGTPTYLTPVELHTLITGIRQHADILKDAEFSIEADPRVTSKEHLITLRELGFTRLSLGIQDFDPRVQKAVNRVQSAEMVETLTEQARTLGFTSINYDLIYGLPLQTQDSVRNTITTVNGMRPDRISFYSYAHVPWIKPAHRGFTEDDLPNGDEKRALYELGRNLLEDAGYREIGMDHFALESDSLWRAVQEKTLHRNFMGYISRQVTPLIGLGVSAIGDSWNMFAQNEKQLERYVERVNEGELPIERGHILTDEDKQLRGHILNLMTRLETNWSDEQKTPFLDSLSDRLKEPLNDQLLKLDNNSCSINENGLPFIRNICMAFDHRLANKEPVTKTFSQTI